MPYQPAANALNGLVVIDLTRVRAGPTCVRQLGDWGADVIKLEIRDAEKGPQSSDFGMRDDADFQNLQRNRRSISLDLKHPEGINVLLKLVKRADVLVENFRPDVKERLHIDYEALKAVNPRLVYASISGFGQDGPYRNRPGVDQIAQGMSGLMSVTGEPGRGPMRVGIAIADLSAGLIAANGILIALYERERSGIGQWVQTSLLQANIFMLDFQAARYLANGEVPKQVGNDHPTGVPTGTFHTRDGHINVAPTPPMWKRFCAAIGREDLVEHPDYATPEARRWHREQINAIIDKITSRDDTATWVERLNKAGIPCGPIYTIDETFDDPQVKHLAVTQQVFSKTLGPLTLLAQPLSLSRTPNHIATAAPEYGEHTDEILGEIGYSTTEIAELHRQGVA